MSITFGKRTHVNSSIRSHHFYLSIFCILLFNAALSQTKVQTRYTRRNITEYYAINGVKHGQFIRSSSLYHMSTVLEFGHYIRDNMSGEWLTFYEMWNNSLRSIGKYTKGMKEGPWTYYYPYRDSDTVQQIPRRAQLISNKDLPNGEKSLEYTTKGQQIMAVGVFEEDHKIGIWNYYSYSGELIHQYDHSNQRLIKNNASNNKNSLIFLGGEERFDFLFHIEFESIWSEIYIRKSEVVYNIKYNDSGEIEYPFISSRGDRDLVDISNTALKRIPQDWIMLDSSLEMPLILHVNTSRSPTDTDWKYFDVKITLQ